MQNAENNADITFLASPVTGGGHVVSRFEQLFITALQAGKKTPDDWASHAWKTIEAQGQRLIKEGKTLETAEENLTELTQQAKAFDEGNKNVLGALKVI
jgi:hypothetical protein